MTETYYNPILDELEVSKYNYCKNLKKLLRASIKYLNGQLRDDVYYIKKKNIDSTVDIMLKMGVDPSILRGNSIRESNYRELCAIGAFLTWDEFCKYSDKLKTDNIIYIPTYYNFLVKIYSSKNWSLFEDYIGNTIFPNIELIKYNKEISHLTKDGIIL